MAHAHTTSAGNTTGTVGGNAQGVAGITDSSRTVGSEGVSSGASMPRYGDAVSAARHALQSDNQRGLGSSTGPATAVTKGVSHNQLLLIPLHVSDSN